jgi:Domain of unknown function (DUF4234)
MTAAPAGGGGAVGKLRQPLIVLLLMIFTLGIYALFWWYRNFEDMKQYSGEGIGGLVGLLLAFFCGFIAIFILPAEVGNLYSRDGKEKPVSGVTGLWNLLPLIGGIIYVFKVQGALNDFWSSKGAS